MTAARLSGDPDSGTKLTLTGTIRFHAKAWLRYAHLHTGREEAARKVVERTVIELSRTWDQVLRQESVVDHLRAVFMAQLDRWLTEHGQRPVMPQTAAFEAARRRTMLQGFQERFAVLDSPLGLYTAISELPERQYDVIVLRFVLGASIEYISTCLGIKRATVSSTINAAKRNLEKRLPGCLRTGDEER